MPIQIPESPATYFEEFFPEQFRAHRSRFPPGDTAAATRFRLTDTGAWSLQVVGGALSVAPIADDGDAALELACTLDDFKALFVGHLRDEVARHGKLSDGSLAALRPLVLTDQKHAVCNRTSRTLALELVHSRAPRRLLVTPGGGRPTAPASTVRMAFADYLLIQTGKRTTTRLFLTRKLKVKGDLTHAVLLKPLLG